MSSSSHVFLSGPTLTNFDFQEEEEEEVAVGGERVIPEDMLQTDTRVGLTSEEVIQRRRKYGLNQMKYVFVYSRPILLSASPKTRRRAWRCCSIGYSEC